MQDWAEDHATVLRRASEGQSVTNAIMLAEASGNRLGDVLGAVSRGLAEERDGTWIGRAVAAKACIVDPAWGDELYVIAHLAEGERSTMPCAAPEVCDAE